jgi:hypothetical protein
VSAFGTALLALAAGGAACGLARLARDSRREWSDAEYERRRRSPGEGALAAAMKALGEELGPGGKVAAEARRDAEESPREWRGGKADALLLR